MTFCAAFDVCLRDAQFLGSGILCFCPRTSELLQWAREHGLRLRWVHRRKQGDATTLHTVSRGLVQDRHPIGKLTSGDLKRQEPITATQWPFKRIQLRDLQQTRTPELTESIITTGLNCNCQQVLLETVPLHRKLVSHILWPKFPSSRHDVRHRFSENLPPLPHDNGVVQLFCTVSSKELLILSSRRARPCF